MKILVVMEKRRNPQPHDDDASLVVNVIERSEIEKHLRDREYDCCLIEPGTYIPIDLMSILKQRCKEIKAVRGEEPTP